LNAVVEKLHPPAEVTFDDFLVDFKFHSTCLSQS
jgi:hypothetical protein